MVRRPPRKIVVKPLMTCPKCEIELRPLGIESENAPPGPLPLRVRKMRCSRNQGVKVTV